MTPNQPEKKEYSRVDAYFRQNAEDIPVTFDPANWNALAAALDAAAGNPTKTLVHRPNRLGKGWWVSGIFLLLLGAAWWTRQGAVINAFQPASQGNTKTIRLDSEQLATPERAQPALPVLTNKILLQKTGLKPEKVSATSAEKYDLPAATIAPIDTTIASQNAGLPTNDSLKILPAKKKKHIFW